MSDRQISISFSNILLIVAVVLGLILLWQLQSLIVILMISVVIAASLSPLVNWAEKMQVPRWLGVICVYLTLIATLTGVGLLIGPTIIHQIQNLVSKLPIFLEQLSDLMVSIASRLGEEPPQLIDQLFDIQSVSKWLIRSSQELVLRSYGITKGFLGGFFNLVLALFISGYLVVDSQTLIKSVVQLFPKPWDEKLAKQAAPVGNRMGGYIRGRLLVSGILGLAITASLSLLGMPEFSLGLGAIAGVTNLIPFIGPVLGAIPALIVAVAKGGWIFLWVLVLFIIIQNVETYILDPLLVGSSVGVHPLYQLLSVLAGIQLLGIIGAIIIPPWFAGTSALVENLYLKPKLLAERKAAKLAEKAVT